MKPLFLILSAAIFAALFFCGCTEYERKGLSPLPHNQPAAWESRPFGEQGFQN